MEGDGICHAHRLFAAVFQSTPSVWRETQLGDQMSAYIAFQSTPSVWRETLLAVSIELISDISIHSLRMDGDVRYDHRQSAVRDFNPLPPYGGRHMGELIKQVAPNISIHSLRMEGDK